MMILCFSGRMQISLNLSSFKVLNKKETGLLTVEEFMNIYEASELKWKEQKGDSGPWFNHVANAPLRRVGEALNKFVKWEVFQKLVLVVLASNAVVKVFAETHPSVVRKVEYGFLVFYIVEATLKIFGLGPKKYFK